MFFSNFQTTTVVEGLSFGQSEKLKDDLDVDDNDVGEKKRQAFLDLLIEAGQNGVILTDDEVREQVNTIMFEGHDTTAAGSSFFLTMMGCHPDIQEKVIEEIDEIFGDSDRPATFQDTLEMKYLERCLMETLRLYPPVPIIARDIKNDLKLGKLIKYFLLKTRKNNCSIVFVFVFSFWRLHRASWSNRRHWNHQDAPSARHLSEPGAIQPGQLLAGEDCQPSLLRVRAVLRWAEILRRQEIRHAQAEDHAVDHPA